MREQFEYAHRCRRFTPNLLPLSAFAACLAQVSPKQTDKSGNPHEAKVTDPNRRDGRQNPFAWLVVGAMAAFMLVCIATAGRNIPLAEDWNLVPAYYGLEPDLGSWLWAQNNEHRLPLP
jgi:hypothetical protein